MAKADELVKKLDDMFIDMLNEATLKTAGDTKNGLNVSFEQKIDLFKEGARWVAIKNKIGENDPDPGAATSRLSRIQKGLKRK